MTHGAASNGHATAAYDAHKLHGYGLTGSGVHRGGTSPAFRTSGLGQRDSFDRLDWLCQYAAFAVQTLTAGTITETIRSMPQGSGRTSATVGVMHRRMDGAGGQLDHQWRPSKRRSPTGETLG